MINQNIKPQWQQLINQEQAKPYFIELNQVISQQRAKGDVIFPAQNDIFNAFCYQDIRDTKVVILGQDPYHGENQAHGLAFSVQPGIKVPPSLVNIYKELVNEFADFNKPSHGCLTQWAEQGVLLLNTVLTVKQAQAQKKGKDINTEKHSVLKGPHPSPLSAYRGFFGCQHFSKTNQWLLSKNMTPINWQLPEQV
jgi:uracil-DNA glycosylase